MAPLRAQLLLALLLLLCGTVQQETLVKQFAAFLNQLHVAHHMENMPVGMPDPVLHADAVSRVFQRFNGGQQPVPVLIDDRGGDGVKAVLEKFRLGRIAQNFQGGPVNAENTGPIQAVTQHAAVHRGKKSLQGLVFPAQLLFIGPLLRHVDGHAHGAHDAAVQIVQGRLVGGQQPGPLAGLDGLLRHAGLFDLHDNPLGLNAGRVVLLHVPDIGVPLALDLFFGLVHGLAEAVVYLLVHAVPGFVPDQVGNAVYGGL